MQRNCSSAWLPLSVYELMLIWRNLLTGYVSHWISTIQLLFFSWVSATYFQTNVGWWGRWNTVSLSGPLLPAFRPRRIMGEMECCLLVWVSATCFQTSQDNGGDKMLSPCLGLCYLLSDLRRIMGEMKCCLLVWVSATCFQTSAG